MTFDPKSPSRTILEGRDRAPARSYLKGIGFSEEDLAKPIIGIANTWIETMPCNFHLRQLAAKVKEGVRAAGGTPMEFNTIAIDDGATDDRDHFAGADRERYVVQHVERVEAVADTVRDQIHGCTNPASHIHLQ